MRSVWQFPAVCLIAATLLSLSALATHTLFWRTTSFPDFERGTAKGVALWSDGMLTPAAQFSTFADPNVAYLWSLRVDSQGRLYASGGSNARVFRFDSEGHATTVFQSPDLTAQAIALDAHDDLYVATSPDGKVYKVAPNGQSSVFFDPKTKYIWSLAVDSQGNVYVGTGDTGEVFVVTPDGKSSLFFKSDERHIRALALDGKGNLIVGTDPSGLVIRVAIERGAAGEPPKAGRAFVLYETAGQEITALTLDPKGDIYAAAIGFKRPTGSPVASPVPGETFVFSAVTPTVTAGQPAQAKPAPQTAAPQGAVPQVVPFNPFAAAPQGGSHVYRIAPDGSPTLLWESPTDLVYALGFSPDGKLLLGTGNNGSVIELEGDELFSKAAETSSGQVTGFASGPGGRIYLCTANPGKIFSLGPGTTAEGTFTSAPFDAKIFSHWGRLNWWGHEASGGQVSFYVRSGNTSNPDENWSQWYGPYDTPEGQESGCPPSRFAQWKAVFHPAAGKMPSLSWVSLAYLPKNVAPEIDDIVMEDPGVRVRGLQIPEAGESILPVQLRMPQNNPTAQDSSVAPETAPVAAVTFQPPPQGFREKGWQSVLWNAHDANGDQLEYSIYYRGEGEHIWKLLKDNLRTEFYSWDTTTMPDGAYYLKIVASDAPSNPPAEALTTERIGPRFVVDNTPPDISGLRAQTATDDATIQFAAKDPSTPLSRAEYSVDAGPWTVVEPVGQLSDAPSETYQIVLKPLGAGEHTISVRVFDLYDNSGIAKITFTVPQEKSAGH
jgi:WD40 repeat protein